MYFLKFAEKLYLKLPPQHNVTFSFVQPGAVATPMGEENAVSETIIFSFCFFFFFSQGSFTWMIRLIKWFLMKTAWQGAQTVLYCATSSNLSKLPSPYANNSLWRFWNPLIDDEEAKERLFNEANARFL
jgi:hypothetical protein